MLLLAVMAQVVPVSALIPVHGIVQLGSNGNRAIMMRQHINWSLLHHFAGGSILGAILASFIVVELPITIIEISIGLFILWMTWGQTPSPKTLSKRGFSIVGLLSTLLTMFVGATGPVVASFIHQNEPNKLVGIASFSACMASQNFLKAVVFSFIGFQFTQWLPLIIIMIIIGALGTWVGLLFQRRIPSEPFRWMFRATLTLLALRLLWHAFTSQTS